MAPPRDSGPTPYLPDGFDGGEESRIRFHLGVGESQEGCDVEVASTRELLFVGEPAAIAELRGYELVVESEQATPTVSYLGLTCNLNETP